MRSSSNNPSRGRGDDGAIGIGTMIVFIAMVIVAAVAAAVLINTSGNLQRKSQETGSDTQEEVSGNLFVRDIIGNVSDNSGDGDDEIDRVSYYLSLAPGAEPIDLDAMVVRWEHNPNLTDLQRDEDDSEGPGEGDFSDLNDGFEVVDVYDAGDGDKNVLAEGDRVKVRVHMNESFSEEVNTQDDVGTLLIPETGTPVNADWTAPSTFGNDDNIDLD